MALVKFKKRIQKFDSTKAIDNKYFYEIDRLEESVEKSLLKVQDISHEIGQIEAKISDILDFYYNKQPSITINSKISIEYIGNTSSLGNNLSICFEDIKNIYYKLSILCNNEHIFEKNSFDDESINKNLHSLIRIEQYLIGEDLLEEISPIKRLNKLSDELISLLDVIRNLKIRKKSSFLEEDDSELRSKIIWIKMQSEDLVNDIKRNIYQYLNNCVEI